MKLNKAWWEHLAPKSMIGRRREVEQLLEDFVRSSDYAREWTRVAANPHGVFRLKPGQVIPAVCMIFMGDRPGFVSPFRKLMDGHRTVDRNPEYGLGALGEGELAIQPTISVEVVTDPVYLAAAMRGATQIDESTIRSPSLVFSVAAHFLLSPKHYPERAYVLYQHIFGAGASYPDDGSFYVGVSTRSWQKRWSEHRRAVETGSPLLFHRRFREEQEGGRLTYVHHKVMAITDELEQLYEAEEFLVEGHWDDERRLNMVPGGKSGLRYLRENGVLSKGVVPLPDDRDKILHKSLSNHPRLGLPAPWVAEKWKDNDWAIAQICGRDGRLSVVQVKAIRELAKNHTPEEIYVRIGAKDVHQVKRVLDGKTYARIA